MMTATQQKLVTDFYPKVPGIIKSKLRTRASHNRHYQELLSLCHLSLCRAANSDSFDADKGTKITTYFTAVILNTIRTYFRKLSLPNTFAQASEDIEVVDTRGSDYHQKTAKLSDEVWKTFNRLEWDDATRRAFKLRHVNNMTLTQIADKMGTYHTKIVNLLERVSKRIKLEMKNAI